MEDVVETVSDSVDSSDAVAAEGIVPQKKKKKPINQQKLLDNLWGWTFCIPLIVGTVWFVYIAFVLALMLSFTNYNLNTTSETMFEYLGHMKAHPQGAFYWYKQVFTYQGGSDFPFWEAGRYLLNTIFYMIGIPIGMVLSMFFAVCMSRDIKGGNVFRVLYYLPCVASTVAIIYTFELLFATNGVFNQLFNFKDAAGNYFRWYPQGASAATWNSLTGAQNAGAFFNDSYWCQGFFQKLMVVIMSVWKGLGGTIILYVAGLSGVNAATKEAAQIDGANGWYIFWKVTMPDLYPVIFYNIVTAVIGGLQIYAEPELLFEAMAPDTSGYVALIWSYGINQGLVAQGAAYGMVLAVLIFVLTMFQFWLDSRNKD